MLACAEVSSVVGGMHGQSATVQGQTEPSWQDGSDLRAYNLWGATVGLNNGFGVIRFVVKG
jgi:hypothetical protein